MVDSMFYFIGDLILVLFSILLGLIIGVYWARNSDNQKESKPNYSARLNPFKSIYSVDTDLEALKTIVFSVCSFIGVDEKDDLIGAINKLKPRFNTSSEEETILACIEYMEGFYEIKRTSSED